MKKPTLKYADKIPRTVKRSIKTLSSDIDWEIVLTLLFEGKKSFNQLAKRLDIKGGNLSHYRKKLLEGDLIENRLSKVDGNYSFYTLSKFGELFMDDVLTFVEKLTSGELSGKSSTTYTGPPMTEKAPGEVAIGITEWVPVYPEGRLVYSEKAPGEVAIGITEGFSVYPEERLGQDEATVASYTKALGFSNY